MPKGKKQKKSDSAEKLKDMGIRIVKDIDKGKNPTITFQLRNLSNIVYDQKTPVEEWIKNL